MTKHLGKNICIYHCETRNHLAATIAAGVFPVNELGSHSLAPEQRCTLSTWRCLTSFMEIFYSLFPNFTAVACLDAAAQCLSCPCRGQGGTHALNVRGTSRQPGRGALKNITVKKYLSIYLFVYARLFSKCLHLAGGS